MTRQTFPPSLLPSHGRTPGPNVFVTSSGSGGKPSAVWPVLAWAAWAAWALRSVSGMVKGLIDIGSDLPCLAPDLWTEAGATAEDAYAAQEPSRGS